MKILGFKHIRVVMASAVTYDTVQRGGLALPWLRGSFQAFLVQWVKLRLCIAFVYHSYLAEFSVSRSVVAAAGLSVVLDSFRGASLSTSQQGM